MLSRVAGLQSITLLRDELIPNYFLWVLNISAEHFFWGTASGDCRETDGYISNPIQVFKTSSDIF